MDLATIGLVVGIAAGAIAVVTAFWHAVRVAMRVEAVIGKDTKGRTLNDQLSLVQTRLGRVEHQLWPNGGSSLVDKVDHQERTLIRVDEQTRSTGRQLDTLFEMLDFRVVNPDGRGSSK